MTTSILTISNPSQLAEFCAVIIPCIWAGSFKSIISSPKRHLTFKLYVQKVLKATQISCTCMILALYYIQKLRAAYPSIHASIGSEVRLFTTALVLANKYLDDNTFTNKTWSEVSSISISELNIMEMEFLSALDYHLHLPQDEFYSWVNQCQQWCISLLPPTPPTVSMKRTFDTLDEQPHMSKKRLMDYSVCKPILSWSSSIPMVQPDFTHQYDTNPYSTPTTPANTNYYLPFVNQQWF